MRPVMKLAFPEENWTVIAMMCWTFDPQFEGRGFMTGRLINTLKVWSGDKSPKVSNLEALISRLFDLTRVNDRISLHRSLLSFSSLSILFIRSYSMIPTLNTYFLAVLLSVDARSFQSKPRNLSRKQPQLLLDQQEFVSWTR